MDARLDRGCRVLVSICVVALAPSCRKTEPEPVQPAVPIKEIGATPCRVRSDPAGASIDLGGQPTGLRTPAEVTLRAGRDNAVTVHKEAFLPETRIANPDLNQVLELDFLLKPGVPVKVRSRPEGAQIRYEGKVVLAATPGTIEALPEGSHTLVARKDGFVDVEQTVKAAPPAIAVELVLPAAAYLRVDSTPREAEVFVDGRSVSLRTPADRVAVRAGKKLRVEARKTGYHAAPTLVRPLAAGATFEVAFALKDVRAAELRRKIQRLNGEVAHLTRLRDRLDSDSAAFIVKDDARRELERSRRLKEVEDKLQDEIERLDEAREELSAIDAKPAP